MRLMLESIFERKLVLSKGTKPNYDHLKIKSPDMKSLRPQFI